MGTMFGLYVWLAVQPAQAPAADAELTVDLARYYYPSLAAEAAARSELNEAHSRLEGMKGRIGATAASLFQALEDHQHVQKLYARHEIYLRLRCALNRRDATVCQKNGVLETDFERRTAFLKAEIEGLPGSLISSFRRAEPRLAGFDYLLETVFRPDPSRTPAAVRETAARLRPELSGWQWPLYQEILAQTPFGQVTAPDGHTIYVSRDRISNYGKQYPEVRIAWPTDTLAYQDPLYYVNYAYVGLIGLELFRQSESEPRGFAQRYTAFLVRGFDAPPEVLLEPLIGRLDPDLLVKRAAATVSARLEALEKLEAPGGQPE